MTSKFRTALDKATGEHLLDANLALYIEVVDLIRGLEIKPKDAMNVMRKRLVHKNPNVALRTLEVAILPCNYSPFTTQCGFSYHVFSLILPIFIIIDGILMCHVHLLSISSCAGSLGYNFRSAIMVYFHSNSGIIINGTLLLPFVTLNVLIRLLKWLLRTVALRYRPKLQPNLSWTSYGSF